MAQKILLIDDDRGIIGVITKILQERGYDVIPAYDGKEGLDIVYKEDPALIVLDIRMPSMDGYEFIRTLRVQKNIEGKLMVPIIVLTAKEEMEEVFKLEGAKAYMVKPVDPEQLVKKIEDCLKTDD